MTEVVAKVPDAQVMGDLDGAVAWADANDGNLRKVGITGFCWGGRITWLYAEQSKNVKAGVAWYGRLVGTPSALMSKNSIDLAAGLKAPVLGLYGGQDSGIPLTTINEMKDALADAGAKGNAAARGSEFVVYRQRRTRFMPTTARVIGRTRLKTASSARWHGSRPTASFDLNLPRDRPSG